MFKLTNKVALVTGAASGIGASISQVFSSAGAITYLADRDLAGAEKQAAELRTAGGQVKAVSLDVQAASLVTRPRGTTACQAWLDRHSSEQRGDWFSRHAFANAR